MSDSNLVVGDQDWSCLFSIAYCFHRLILGRNMYHVFELLFEGQGLFSSGMYSPQEVIIGWSSQNGRVRCRTSVYAAWATHLVCCKTVFYCCCGRQQDFFLLLLTIQLDSFTPAAVFTCSGKKFPFSMPSYFLHTIVFWSVVSWSVYSLPKFFPKGV